MTELGNLSLLFLLVMTAFAAVCGFTGGLTVRPRLVRAAERALLCSWGLTLTAMIAKSNFFTTHLLAR